MNPFKSGLSSRTVGGTLLGLGIIVALASWALAALTSQRSLPQVCRAQSVVFHGSTVSLESILPVAGQGFTALEAALTVSDGSGIVRSVNPQLRQALGGQQLDSGAQTIERWNGIFSIDLASYSPASGCVVLDLKWRPFGNWIGWSLAIAAIGAVMLLAANIRATALALNPVAIAVPALLLIGLGGSYFVGRGTPLAKLPYPRAPVLIKARQSLNQGVVAINRWQILADAMTRHGQFAEAAEVLTGAIKADAKNAEAWLAMGDVLFAYRDGTLSQAAEFAYDQADHQASQPDYVATAMDRSQRPEIAVIWRKRQALLTSDAALSNRPSSATDAR